MKTQTLPVDQIHPNDYNPNTMGDEEFAELVAELRHLGRLPKPIVVRPAGSEYQLVDGEHSWRAAKEIGFDPVPCEVVDADDFEAMRQTYKRNRHGTNNPVRLGQMFRRMLTDRGLSQRALAEEIAVSEGTIRNAIIYAEAADLRNSYAFEELPVRSVRAYVSLPKTVRDAWLDAGADPVMKERFEANHRSQSAIKGCWDKLLLAQSLVPSDRYYMPETAPIHEQTMELSRAVMAEIQADWEQRKDLEPTVEVVPHTLDAQRFCAAWTEYWAEMSLREARLIGYLMSSYKWGNGGPKFAWPLKERPYRFLRLAAISETTLTAYLEETREKNDEIIQAQFLKKGYWEWRLLRDRSALDGQISEVWGDIFASGQVYTMASEKAAA